MEILKLYFLGELPNFKKLGQLCETRQCYNRSYSAVKNNDNCSACV